MSTTRRPGSRVLPPLEAGQRLDQPTFHARYEAMPHGTWAELVGGIVYTSSPLFDDHGGTGEDVSFWLGHYRRFTPGLRGGASVSTILPSGGEVQPDHQLRLLPDRGGNAVVVGGPVVGTPELIVEVAKASKTYDLGPKKSDYERSGVPEYVVVALDLDRVHWFVLREGHYVEQTPGPDGLFRSDVFPGLWLDPVALFAGDLDGLIAALERGLATPEHAEFVARLAEGGRAG